MSSNHQHALLMAPVYRQRGMGDTGNKDAGDSGGEKPLLLAVIAILTVAFCVGIIVGSSDLFTVVVTTAGAR